MALSTPILETIAAFDANNTQFFRFKAIGGDQVIGALLTIISQNTGLSVYTREIQSGGNTIEYDYQQATSGGKLTNGQYYMAYVQTKNISGEYSSPSNSIQFYCYTTPTLEFANFPTTVVNGATYTFNVTYSQDEGEQLNSYVFNLYNIQGVRIATSGTLYARGSSDLEYTFSGFESNTVYGIEVIGTTVSGTSVSIPRQNFNVIYSRPSAFSLMELSNNCEGGYITIHSNLVNISGVSNPEPPNYVKDNTAVDAKGEGEYVQWNRAFEINGDYTMQLWGYDFNPNTTIISLKNNLGDQITVDYCIDPNDATKVYVDASVVSDGLNYYIYSESIDYPAYIDKVQIWLRRSNGLYQIGLYIVEEVP